MRHNKISPFELGRQHAQEWLEAGKPKIGASRNPYEHPSEPWAQYNHGYNRTAYPELFTAKELSK